VRAEKRAAEEAEQLSKDRARRKANLVREEALEKTPKASKTKRIKNRAAEEIKQSTRDQARKDTYLAREQVITKAQEARKFRAKKQPPK